MMMHTLNNTATKVAESLQSWEDLVCLQRVPASFDSSHGDFVTLKLDVFYRGSLPDHENRLLLLPNLQRGESSFGKKKDRVRIDNVPVHLEYKQLYEAEDLVDIAHQPPHLLVGETTYGLFRIANGIPLWDPQGWMSGLKDRLEKIPLNFWEQHTKILRSRILHLLNDLSLSFYSVDNYSFIISFSRSLQTLAECLFTLNHEFLPTQEDLDRRLLQLEKLPTGFHGAWDSLVREKGLDRSRKLEVVQHLGQSVLLMT